MVSEFDLIRRYFVHPTPATRLGVGDDCALLACESGQELAVSTDLLVAGRHFLATTDATRLGYKAAAVNLSDMAAMGAQPRWVTLGLSLPQVDEPWLQAFSQGFHDCLQAHDTDWVGGDTTAGPLTIAVTILGQVPVGQALRRSLACAGDDIWVSGTLGDAALGLRYLQSTPDSNPPPTAADRAFCIQRLEQPTPRVALGLALRGWAHAAIDVSDGLLADLGHVLQASGVGARVFLERLPRSPALQRHLAQNPQDVGLLLRGGDDYELCFTATAQVAPQIQALGQRLDLALTRIGEVTCQNTRQLLDAQGHPVDTSWQGYDHFG